MQIVGATVVLHRGSDIGDPDTGCTSWNSCHRVKGWEYSRIQQAVHSTPLKTNTTLENHHYLIGDTSSNGCFSIVMLVFGGVLFRRAENLRMQLPQFITPARQLRLQAAGGHEQLALE